MASTVSYSDKYQPPHRPADAPHSAATVIARIFSGVRPSSESRVKSAIRSVPADSRRSRASSGKAQPHSCSSVVGSTFRPRPPSFAARPSERHPALREPSPSSRFPHPLPSQLHSGNCVTFRSSFAIACVSESSNSKSKISRFSAMCACCDERGIATTPR